MTVREITCPLCGQTFDASQNMGCEACPFHTECAMFCCPDCGYSTINPDQSNIANWVKRLFKPKPKQHLDFHMPFKKRHHHHQQDVIREVSKASEHQILSLAEVPPGQRARVIGFSPDLLPSQRVYLQTYGVLEGYWLRVVQQTPVTVIQIEHTELALENNVAAQICVTDLMHAS